MKQEHRSILSEIESLGCEFADHLPYAKNTSIRPQIYFVYILDYFGHSHLSVWPLLQSDSCLTSYVFHVCFDWSYLLGLYRLIDGEQHANSLSLAVFPF